jgi:hypothetical protein
LYRVQRSLFMDFFCFMAIRLPPVVPGFHRETRHYTDMLYEDQSPYLNSIE